MAAAAAAAAALLLLLPPLCRAGVGEDPFIFQRSDVHP